MVEIELKQIPNQTFSQTIDGIAFDFRLYVFRDMTYCDISAEDGASIAAAVRCVPNEWVIPFEFARVGGVGNFRFEVDGDDYPWFENFGDSCRFVYYTADEISAMEA